QLPPSGALALVQRGLDADDRVETGHDVGVGHADLGRWAVGQTREVHDSTHALDDEVVAGTRSVWAVLTEAGDRAVDEARILLLQALVVEPERGETANLEVLDQNVGITDEIEDEPTALFGVEIGGDRALAAVRGVEIGGVFGAVGVVDEWRSPAARIVAFRALYLDHLGPEISEDLPRPRPCEHAGEFDDLEAGK